MIKRKTIAALIFLLIVAIWAVGLGRYILIAKAKDKANEFAVFDNADPENVVRKVTAAVHKKFYRHKDATDDNSAPLLMRLRPYLTNSRLPEFIKIPEGAIETLYARGWCDNAVRMTRFILLQHGLQTRQWNIVTPVGAHAALVVDIHRKIVIFSDPFYGVFSKNPQALPDLSRSRKTAAWIFIRT